LGSLAFIGLSQVRESAVFSGIPLVERLGERTCGVWVVHIESGETIGFLRFEAGVQEIFAVQVLHGIRFPELLEWNDERMAHSYVLPDEALAEVVLPTPEQAAQTAPYHFQLANRLYEEGKLEEAVAAYRRCLELEPSYPDGRFNLAVALGNTGRYDEAAVYMEDVIREEPERAEAYNSLGYLASRQGELEKAISYWRRAIQLRPDYAQAHFSLGLTLLQIGDYESGFAECEWRWRTGHLTPFRFAQPRWEGRPISGRTLLVIFEQGVSEAIQFARYLPLAAERCGKLILSCAPDLMPLFAAVSGIAQLCEPRQIGNLQFDYYLPLLSLPYVFGTKVDTIPATVPYLDAVTLRGNRDSFVPLASPYPRIGVYWRDGATLRNHQASCDLSDLFPILRNGSVTFYSLQRGQENLDLAQLPADIQVQKPDPEPADVRDLARIIEQLDLVVSVDAPVIHLAGAMGKAVWSLLAYTPDWRWGLTGERTPWYPTMRLFRQLQPGDWTGIMERMALVLKRVEWQLQSTGS
jgi:tetratricopeptide (TPR) repeat protein